MVTDTVSVIIPAFNARRWIADTLASACAQTHRDLQVIVVDDGSSDDTAVIVDAMTRQDSRIMLIRQANGGVARARNAGIAAAVGAFIAPLDADDLWAPRKIELQLDALRRAPAGTVLAYNWYRRIDGLGRVLPVSPYPLVEGHVYLRHLEWNFISNGSTPLVRADVARAIGYDPALRDCGVEGTEDYLFQLRVAREHRFICVPRFLTGYRASPGSMGAQSLRMARSHIQTFDILARDAPLEARPIIARRSAQYRLTVAGLLARAGDIRLLGQLGKAVTDHPPALMHAALRKLRLRKRGTAGAPLAPLALFASHDIAARDGDWRTLRSAGMLARLAVLDEHLADPVD